MIKIFFLKLLNKYASKWLVLFIDVLLSGFSFVVAYFIRFNLSFNFEIEKLFTQLPIIFFISMLSFLLVGSYKGVIRHTGTRDAFNVFVGVSILSSILVFTVILNRVFIFSNLFTIPISIILIHYLVAVFILVVSRFIFKSFYEIISSELKTITNVLIYGAGDSGLITYGALNKETKINFEVVGFIDDDKNKIGKKIDRVKVFDLSNINKEFIESNDITEVVISIQNIKPERLLEITDELLKFEIKVKIVPPLSKWIEGDLKVNQIEQVKIEDLLDRTPISIDNPILKRDLNEEIVFVTGAAGSIGSEISRQVLLNKPKHLILIDQAESELYNLQQELIQKGINNFTVIVADIRDRKRLEFIFDKYNPQKVFHAAAYKHVPLMEQSPYEAVKINVSGTKNVADLSLKFNVKRFVMVSTDKAVNPTNVMGATKRVAELYINCLSSKSKSTKFIITRFGNVLGSNGSVIPLFKKQILEGGPLTVTHQEITRYFMTIPEACNLVLEAGAMGDGGEIYIFDMGKSMRIFDIAKKMIDLSGLNYPEEIDIKITGLRPGEKLYEELLANGENTKATYHNKIMIADTQKVNYEVVGKQIEDLCSKNLEMDNELTVSIIKKIIPEFISNNSEYEKLD